MDPTVFWSSISRSFGRLHWSKVGIDLLFDGCFQSGSHPANHRDCYPNVYRRSFLCWVWRWSHISFEYVRIPPTNDWNVIKRCSLVPLYQSETAPKWIRGIIVGSYQFAITIGLLLAAIVDNSTKDRQDSGSYRIPIAVQFAWSLILVFGMLLLPETPRYLIRSGKPEKAAKALSTLRRLPSDDPAIVEELTEVQANHEHELTLGKSSYLDCFRGKMLKRQLTGMGLQALQQLTGQFSRFERVHNR